MNDLDRENDEFSERLAASLADLQPSQGLEDRIIGRLRQERKFFGWHVKYRVVEYAAAAVAATILLGGVGYIAWQFMGGPRRMADHFEAMEMGRAEHITAESSTSSGNSRYEEMGGIAANVTKAPSAQIPMVATSDAYRQRLPKNVVTLLTPPPAVPLGVAIAAGRDKSGAMNGATYDFANRDRQNVGEGQAGTVLSAKDATLGLGVALADKESAADQNKAINTGVTENANAAASMLRGDSAPGGGFGGGGAFGGGRVMPASVRPMVQTANRTIADAISSVPLAAAAQPAPAQPPPVVRALATDRKIIRSGQMNFEVDNFDAVYQRLRDIIDQSGGYIGATDSHRLPNGAVEGTVTVRVPPENLDDLVLKLRVLGDLTEQHISAQDITKEYTDLQSELVAAKAMEDRLLDLIRHGNGQVKDLLAVEKELGTWREKVEQVTGQINYYNNLVALSTLQVMLAEKGIGETNAARTTDAVTLACDDVESTYHALLDFVNKADGGRVVSSSLTWPKPDVSAGTVVFEVKESLADAVLAFLKSSGAVLQLDVTENPDSADVTASKRAFSVSLNPLSEIWPRETEVLEVRSGQPEKAAEELIAAAQTARAKVVEHSSSAGADGRVEARVVILSPLSAAQELAAVASGKGSVREKHVDEDSSQAIEGPAARARLEIHFASETPVVGDDNGLAATIKEGLSTSIRGLLWSMELVVIGLCLVLPWALVVWLGWRWWRRKSS
jgi:Domain of unknown function (DUF4349)